MAPSYHERLQADISKGLSSALAGGLLSVDEAMEKVTSDLLANNPFVPPNGCPVNDLPFELLAHIFIVGMDLDLEEEGEIDEEDYDLAGFPGSADSVDSVDSDYRIEVDIEDAEDDDEDPDWVNEGEESSAGSESESASESESEAQLPFQVLVSHVCKRWRQVAIESPVLWAFIDFHEGAPFQRSRTWVERSKATPLTIELDCTTLVHSDKEPEEGEELWEEKPFFSMDDLHTIMEIILPHVERWQSLEVMVNTYDYVHYVMTCLAQCKAAPLLEVLQLYHYDDSEDFERFEYSKFKAPLTLFHGNAPMLAHVALWGVHIYYAENDVDDSTPNLLSGLVDLELAYHTKDVRPSWSAFTHILRSSPELHTLTLCLSGPAELPEWSSESIIEVPSIKELVLRYHEPEYISPLMQLLSVPNLQSLAIDYDGADYSSFARQLASPPPGKTKSLLAGLENLKISGLPCDHMAVEAIYGQLGNLQKLNLNCSSLEDVFMDKLLKPIPSSTLSSGSVSSMYCPLLHTITVTGTDGAAMKTFVEMRRSAGFPVKHVLMSEEDPIEEREERWLREHLDSLEFFEPSDSEDDIIEEEEEDLDDEI